MRGKESKAFGIRFNHRITPAYAGKSKNHGNRRSGSKDHPRLCGEKQRLISTCGRYKGSPPPMRGKVTVSSSSRVMMGITPAYAGKRDMLKLLREKRGDHPRLCGEKAVAGVAAAFVAGSPPPMRGKEPKTKKLVARFGITPAYAGKSLAGLHDTPHVRDHPRLCGEKKMHLHAIKKPLGSPPPMRGKGHGISFSVCIGRITPAYAGKS